VLLKSVYYQIVITNSIEGYQPKDAERSTAETTAKGSGD